MQLSSGLQVIASFYLVYPEPSSILAPQSSGCDAAAQTSEYSWSLVTRGTMLMLFVGVAEHAVLHVSTLQAYARSNSLPADV